jgi:hypothetical protein
MNQFLNGTPDNRNGSPQPAQSGWSKTFSLPAPPVTTPEQQAAMDQFQQLLKPHSSPDNPAKATALGSPLFSPSSTAHAPDSAAVIPVGASYTPLSAGIATPTGVTPLPGLLGPTNELAPAFVPEWKPQSPPWMSSTPQLGVMPPRKF